MLVKLSDEIVTFLGAKDPAQAAAGLATTIHDFQKLKSTMAETTTNFEALAQRIKALEDRQHVTAETVNAQIKAGIADARAEIITAATAEASRTVTTALASVGTAPVKPAPVSADVSTEDKVKSLEAAGKYEEAFALLPAAERSQYLGAKSYAAYRKAARVGRVAVHGGN